MFRKFLITKFVCAKCGSNLCITYNTPKTSPGYEEGQPTGAEMVENIVAVEPCETCARPLEKVRDALKTLNELAAVAK